MVGFPALNTAGVPFVRIVSCNPLEIKGDGIAPVFSGYPAGDRTGRWGGGACNTRPCGRPPSA